MTPLVLFATAFVVRAVVGTLFAGPAYPNSYYYVNLAEQLATGHGLSVDFIWNFVEVGGQIPADPTLPIPSNAHWLPLAALVQVPFIWLLGATPLAFGLPFWLIGAAAASADMVDRPGFRTEQTSSRQQQGYWSPSPAA